MLALHFVNKKKKSVVIYQYNMLKHVNTVEVYFEDEHIAGIPVIIYVWICFPS